MVKIAKKILFKYKDIDGIIFGLKKITPTTLQRKCDNNCKCANIDKNIRIHDFRHSLQVCVFLKECLLK